MADVEPRFVRPQAQQLKSWTVRNFKAIEFAETPLTGLVAIAGPNSSGKSSLLQSLLLLAQSGDHEISLNGSLVRLGVPRDVIRAGAPALSIACSATAQAGKSLAEWHVELTLRATQEGLRVSECAIARDGESVFLASDARVTERAHSEVDSERAFGDTILRVREIDGLPAPSRTYVTFNGLIPAALHTRVGSRSTLAELRRTFSLAELRGNPEAAERFTDLVFSNFYRAQVEKGESSLTDAVRAVISGDLFREDTAARLSRSALDEILVALAERGVDGAWQPIQIRAGVAYAARRPSSRYLSLMIPSYAEAFYSLLAANEVLSRVGTSVRYLGPLREEPQVVSKSGSRSQSSPVGLRGELTAELLSTRTRSVQFWDWDGRERRTDLIAAVSAWAGYLGIGEDVSVEDQGKLGRGLRIRVNGVARDLTMIGVGASQLLPVLTVVLDAPAGSVVLLEQPELHLHPSVQSRLGDFLLFARRDVCVVVETHSEYLITRLRRRIAERRATAENVHVLFAEEMNGATEVRELHVSDLGNLDEWPRGFFDAQDEEARAIVQAVAIRRSAK